MKVKILIFSLISNIAIADNKWYGVFSGDTYPVKNCYIFKISNILLREYSTGTNEQYHGSIKKDNYTNHVHNSITNHLHNMIEKAKQKKYNALINYKYDVFGGFTGYNKTINGSNGFGAFIVRSDAVPVNIKCNQ